MADKNTLAQMLEHLVNDDQQKAEELFHEYIVAKSREIYEGLIEDELKDEEVEESSESDEEEVEESAESDEEVDESSDEENFSEADEDMPFGDEEEEADPTDNLTGELDAEMGDDEGEESPEEEAEEIFQDIKDAVDQLEAIWQNGPGDMGSDMDGDMGGEKPMKDDFDDGSELETVREYVEKVPAGHGAEKKGASEKADGNGGGLKFVKNDMGGTTANILSGRNGAAGSETGALKGNGLLKGSPKEDNAGNINVPGAKNGNAFSKKEPGHGAEKKGAAEQADNKQSLFRGRR
jgi:hypothetical protein